MAQDRIGGIVRALVGVPQERLVVVQKVVNDLNLVAAHGDQFQIELSKFVLGWKPAEATMVMMDNPNLPRWSDNYYKLFNQRPDLSQILIPEKPKDVGSMRLIVVVHELLDWTNNRPLQGVQNTLKKHFPCWQYATNLDDSITTNDRDPKNGSYAVWVKDVREADEENANKSADDLKAENHTGITVLERQLFEYDYSNEKGEHLDQQNWTLCSGSRNRGGYVPRAYWDVEFNVYWYEPAARYPILRSRRVWA